MSIIKSKIEVRSVANPKLLILYPDPSWRVITDPDPTVQVISDLDPALFMSKMAFLSLHLSSKRPDPQSLLCNLRLKPTTIFEC